MTSGLILITRRDGLSCIIVVCLLAIVSISVPVAAQTQSHPLSQVSPIDTDLNMNSRNISSLNYLLYSGGIFYSGSQGIPTADIAASAVTSSKIANGAITSSDLSNPLGGSLNASAYYDSDNSNYYLDPASSGTSLSTAGNIVAGGYVNTSRYIYGTETFSSMVIQPAHQSYLVVAGSTGATTVTFGAGEGSSIATYMPAGITFPFTIYSSTDTSNPIFRVLSTGRVGLGTGVFNTGIEAVLDIDGAADLPQLRIVDNDGSPTTAVVNFTRINNVAAGSQSPNKALLFIQDQASNYPLHIQDDSGNPLFTVNGSGSIGINTTSPSARLDISTVPAETRLKVGFGTIGDDWDGQAVHILGNSPDRAALAFQRTDLSNNGGNHSGTYRIIVNDQDRLVIDRAVGGGYNGGQGIIAFERSTRNVLIQNGNVGIGTLTPANKLNVVGDLNVTGTIYGAINTTGDVNCTECVGTADIASSAVTTAKIANSAVTAAKLASPLGGSVNGTAYYDSDNSNYYLDPANSGDSLIVAGDVGIGTTNPVTRLDVNGNYSIQGSRLAAQLSGPTALEIGGGYGSFNIYLGPSTGTAANVIARGNVGIGTSSPDTLLKLSGSSPYLRVRNTGSSNKEWDIHGTGNDLALEETGVGTSLTLKAGGNVGIGTASPVQKLEVSGHIQTSGNLPHIFINGSQTGGDQAFGYLKWASTQTARQFLLKMGGVSASPYVDLSYASDGSSFSNLLYINASTGAVGIGTTTPSHKLHIGSGAVRYNPGTDQNLYLTTGFNLATAMRIQSENDEGSSLKGLELRANPIILVDGDVGVQTTTPQSALHINGTGSSYLQLDVNATALASTDCDAESERGRTIVDGSNVRLHICYGASGWKTLTPA